MPNRLSPLTLVALGGALLAAYPAASATQCDAADWESPPARQWVDEQGWRFASLDAAKAAYAALLAKRPSAWPDWNSPSEVELPAGTRFQQALHVGQSAEQFGRWGTFDAIHGLTDVRYGLAVRWAWGNAYDRVAVVEVVKPLKARIGTVGPQVDPDTCTYLPGRWSQIEIPREHSGFRAHLRLISVRPLEGS